MLYPELETKIANKEVMAGDVLWITDYRHDDILDKPIRHVAPTEVRLVSNDDLPPNKKIYYANYHFRVMGKNGKLNALVIAPYDNTGYKWKTGTSLNIFFTEAEAKAHYVEQSNQLKVALAVVRQEQNERFDRMLAEMDERINANL